MFNARSLAAFVFALKGDSASAGRQLAAMEWQCAREVNCSLDNYDIVVHHLAAANWLLQAGDTTESQRLLLWHEAWQAGRYWSMTEVLAGLTELRKGELADAQGRLSAPFQLPTSHGSPGPATRLVGREGSHCPVSGDGDARSGARLLNGGRHLTHARKKKRRAPGCPPSLHLQRI